MKKIMFNDLYRLTQAVLEGWKTQTRRITKIEDIVPDVTRYPRSYPYAHYNVGEEVAVAQSYYDIEQEFVNHKIHEYPFSEFPFGEAPINAAGWKNKMFTKAKYLPHRIKITNVRVERLQDISEEDCLKEGIYESLEAPYNKKKYGCYNSNINASSPREAFAALIDKTCGRGTWDSNPWVFVYDFELIK